MVLEWYENLVLPDDNDDLENDALEENSGWLAEQESNETTQ